MNASIVEKIAKLRKLATSSNVNEAAAAAAAADKLMQQHGIEEAQLEAAGEAPKEAPVADTTPIEFVGKAPPTWRQALAVSLIDHYDCSCYKDRAVRNNGSGLYEDVVRLHVFGRPTDIASVRYMYAWLNLEIERLAMINSGRGRTWLNSFRHGAVRGVMRAMREAKNAVMQQAKTTASTSAAIVLVNARANEALALRDRLNPKLGKGRAFSAGRDAGAFSAGVSAGRTLGTQHKSMTSGSGTKALRG